MLSKMASFLEKTKKENNHSEESFDPEEKENVKKIEITEENSDNDIKEDKETGDDEKKKDWFETEGQLTVDVYQTDEEIVVQAPIAGVDPENIDVAVENDMVIIKGKRLNPDRFMDDKKFFYQECFWGNFSRRIILPEETDLNRAEAVMKNGVLTIRIPRIEKTNKKKILVKR